MRPLLKSDSVLVKPLIKSELLSAILKVLKPDDAVGLSEPSKLPDRNSGTVEEEEARYSRILIVEDNELNQLIYQELFKPYFDQIVLVHSGKAAVKIVLSRLTTFDVVLMDVELADINGYEAARMIRESDQKVPIIANTAHTSALEKQKCLESGMNDVVSKPIDPAQLISTVKKWAEKRKREEGVHKRFPSADKIKSETVGFVLPEKTDFVNAEALLQRLNGNYQQLYYIYEAFLKEHSDYATKIRNCAAEKDYDALKRHVHNLKGVAVNLSLDGLYHYCQEFEQAFNKIEEKERNRMVDRLAILMESTKQELTLLLRKADSTNVTGESLDTKAHDSNH